MLQQVLLFLTTEYYPVTDIKPFLNYFLKLFFKMSSLVDVCFNYLDDLNVAMYISVQISVWIYSYVFNYLRFCI